jgi:hypothetical protein
MYKINYWFFALVFFLAACGGKNGVPSGVLQKDSMQVVLKDLMRVDEFVTMYIAKDSSKNQKLERLRRYEQVFALHKTTQAEFKNSLEYYKEKPHLMKEIFDSISTREIVKVDSAALKHSADSIKKADSLKKITTDTSLKKITPDSSFTKAKLDSLKRVNKVDSFKPHRLKPDTALLRRFRKLNQK